MVNILTSVLLLAQVAFAADYRCWYNPSTTVQGGIAQNGKIPTVNIPNCMTSIGCVPCSNVNDQLRKFKQETACGFKRSFSDGCSMPDLDVGFGSLKTFWKEACIQHDFCYSDVRSPLAKSQCDDILAKDMRALCQTLDYGPYEACLLAQATAKAVLSGASQAQEAYDYDRKYCGARREPWNGNN